ncbi:uncharacterized protein EV420DRAFT_1684490 [Desarmillaria tabescens]|uniref:Uncharacterized protein n=1 Tax=Armillaria tabescens TaxID=1929756 RepID=A0AA39TRE4_ARMTA|nr:uncharacterized protein EV420DRAFT_1684490 [Desarmillaria tabescens]KAK0467832.1 hypothetical protein EV420DRAFT_1684490 [Desarmillaria tabescens]
MSIASHVRLMLNAQVIMSLPAELVFGILFSLWSIQSCTEERVQTFKNCSLVSRCWSAIMKDVNSTHSVIPLSYNGSQMYTIRAISSIPNPSLCRTITFKVDYMVLPQLLIDMECEPSITANKGIESALRRLFCGSKTPQNATHIYVDYLDDPQVHIPRFWIPQQITQLTIIYHYRRWVPFRFRCCNPCECECNQPAVDQKVIHLSVMGATSVIVQRLTTPLTKWKCLASLTTDAEFLETDIPVTLRDAFTRREYNYPDQEVGPDFVRCVMFGERMLWSSLLSRSYPIGLRVRECYISMLEQVIPLGSVGYIGPLTRKFIVLFNAIDPVASSTEPRIHRIPSLLKKGVTKLTENPNYSSSPGWDYEYKRTDILRMLGAWSRGRSVYSIPLGFDMGALLFLALGRAFSRELVGDYFEEWLYEQRQTITDVFGDDHPFIRRHLDLVTTTVDSSQYAWFAHLGQKSRKDLTEDGSSTLRLRATLEALGGRLKLLGIILILAPYYPRGTTSPR